MPREHGHLSFYNYDPQNSPFTDLGPFSRLPRGLARKGRVRRLLSRWVARKKGFTGYFQLYNVPFERLEFFDYLEQKDIYQPGGLRGGTPTVFDYLREQEIPFFLSDWRASEEKNLGALESAMAGGRLRFAYLYLASLDAILHAHGTRSNRVNEEISWYETQLRRLIAIARTEYEVDILLFSDHGMTDIVEHCDLIPRIEALGLEFGRDYAAMYDSTMARFWFLSERGREAIVPVLEREKRGAILRDADLARYEVDFPDHRFGDLFFLLSPGVLLCPSYMGERPLAGMHGYAPEDPRATASFATNLEPAPRPRRLDDLYGVMIDSVAPPLVTHQAVS
jgi:hypothetical protein